MSVWWMEKSENRLVREEVISPQAAQSLNVDTCFHIRVTITELYYITGGSARGKKAIYLALPTPHKKKVKCGLNIQTRAC